MADEKHTQCNKWLQAVVTKKGPVQTLIDSIETLGCTIPKDFFVCRPCDAEVSGGFAVASSQLNGTTYKPQVVACENNLIERETFEHTIAHELIHAYDVCRANIDFKQCEQHACTEIRASALSGECGILHEIYRGQYTKWPGGHQNCVKRRATKSLDMNPNCKGNAKEIVDKVFAKCYADSSPFPKM